MNYLFGQSYNVCVYFVPAILNSLITVLDVSHVKTLSLCNWIQEEGVPVQTFSFFPPMKVIYKCLAAWWVAMQ